MDEVEATVTRIVDGDTFVCTIHAHLLDLVFDWQTQYIRIVGMDAPELEKETYAAAMQSKIFLENLLLNNRVKLRSEGKRSFHRLLARVYLPNGDNVADLMIKEGLAIRDERK